MDVVTRQLRPGDEAALEAFLARHANSSMFLRSNVRAAGLTYRGEPQQATYVAVITDDGGVAGVAAHAWNGLVILQAPAHAANVTLSAVEASRRAVTGFLGPWDQVVAARAALGLADAAAKTSRRELLYRLELADLAVPAELAQERATCRRARPEDLDLLALWRAAFKTEALGEPDGDVNLAEAHLAVRRQHDNGDLYVLEADGAVVSTTAFNARLAEMVQVGGVYTPPPLRCRHHARAAVAGSLLDARATGAASAILFTDPDGPARRAYESLGFREIGDYGIVLLASAAQHRYR